MGAIGALNPLTGSLSCEGGLSGQLSLTKEYDTYIGEYSVVPQAFNAQTLPTANRLLSKDVVVSPVPYFEVHNDSDGVTAYIAKEV